MIIINGKPYRTLKDPIYENGKRVLKVFVDGEQAYPETYKKPVIGSSGNVLKIRGKHTTELNLYSDGEFYHGYDFGERISAYNETIRCTVSYAAYMRNVPASKEGKIILENDKGIAPYFRSSNFVDDINQIYGLKHRNIFWELYSYSAAEDGRFGFSISPSYDHYTNYIELHGTSYALPTFFKFIFKVKIDPFYIPSEGTDTLLSPYANFRTNKNFIYRPSLFNNKIFTVYSKIAARSTTSINETYSFYNQPTRLIIDTNGNLYSSFDLDYFRNNDICVMMATLTNCGFYHDNVLKAPFSISIVFIDVTENGAIVYGTDSSGGVTVSKPVYLELPLFNNYFICSPDEILYLGNELDQETNKEVPIITKEDLIDFDGSEEVIEPVIYGRGYTTTDEEKLYTEVESDDTIIKQGIYGIYTTTVHCPNATEIEPYAFYNNVRLIYAIFPNVTTVGQGAFHGCCGLAVADFQSLLSIPESCFTNNIALKTISFPVCTSIGSRAFMSCRSLASVDFPACTTIEKYAFLSCISLTEASFPVCTYIGSGAFYSCTSLTSVSFPACTTIESYAFQNCGNLDAFEAPNLIAIREKGFAYCSSLKNAIIPRVEIIESAAFVGCSSLSSLTLLTVSFIAYQAFQNCVNLESVFLPGPYVCRTNGTMFNNTKIGTGQGSILVPESLVSTYKTATGWSEYSSVITAI